MAPAAWAQVPTPALAPETRWAFHAPNDPVQFIGAPDPNAIGPDSIPIVISPSLAMTLASVVVRSVVSASRNDEHRARQQEQAKGDVEVFTLAMGKLTHEPLAAAAAALMRRRADVRFVGAGSEPSAPVAAHDERPVHYRPTFMMTRDRQAMLVNAQLRIESAGRPDATLQREVRVVSAALNTGDLGRFELVERWNADDGRLLHDTAASLLAEALDAAVDDLSQPATATPEAALLKVSYKEGTFDRVDSGTLLRETCERIVLRRPNGSLLSVPRADLRAPPCSKGNPPINAG